MLKHSDWSLITMLGVMWNFFVVVVECLKRFSFRCLLFFVFSTSPRSQKNQNRKSCVRKCHDLRYLLISLLSPPSAGPGPGMVSGRLKTISHLTAQTMIARLPKKRKERKEKRHKVDSKPLFNYLAIWQTMQFKIFMTLSIRCSRSDNKPLLRVVGEASTIIQKTEWKSSSRSRRAPL